MSLFGQNARTMVGLEILQATEEIRAMTEGGGEKRIEIMLPSATISTAA